MDDVAIRTRGLTKTFPPKKRRLVEIVRREPRKPAFTALAGVDLDVRRGELFGLLGPNGAGKTTLVKILSTLLLPTSGEASILGLDVRKDAQQIRQRVGVVLGGDRALYWRLTARENLWYFSQLYDMPSAKARAKIEDVLSIVGLAERADDRVENYSKGMKQRLHIARGLLTDPEILLLDEPTIGLDPHAGRSLRALVRDLVDKHGRTVILTTHYMYEADELSDRIGVLHKGRIIALDTSASLKARYAKDRALLVRVQGDAAEAERILRAHGEVRRAAAEGDVTALRLRAVPDASELAARLTKAGVHLVGLQVEEPSLEDVFVALTGEGLVEQKHEGDDE
ncbi:MAG: type transport system ATP-binding protein [Thermoplasmata archaeon]|nr:type transport system ATP-binding protein [Thermoplasmata archaeon]